MALLDAPSLAKLTNRAAINDPAVYAADYITAVIADATSAICGFLQYDPVLQVVTAEEGPIERDSSGIYRGLYRLQTNVAPFIPGTAAQVFSSLQLLFARAILVTAPADLTYVTLEHPFGRAFLSPGAMQFLQGVSLEVDGPFGAFMATAYSASYVAGYATGIADPTLPGNVPYGAAPMPGAITQAAVLLCRERLAMDDAANLDPANPFSGQTILKRSADQEERFAPMTAGDAALGYGTALSQAAARRLMPFRRMRFG